MLTRNGFVEFLTNTKRMISGISTINGHEHEFVKRSISVDRFSGSVNIRATCHAVASGLVIASREGWFGVGGSVVNSTLVPGLRTQKTRHQPPHASSKN